MNNYLEIGLENGQLVLNSQNVNYSFGGLHRAFADTFAEIEVRKYNPQLILILGLGVGSVPTLLRQADIAGKIIGVEADSVVLALGKQYFALNQISNLEIVQADALDYVFQYDATKPKFDLIVVDLFIDTTVPTGSESKEYLQALAHLLNSNGLLVFNRIIVDEPTQRATLQFQENFKQVFPNYQIYQTSPNQMFLNRAWR